MINVEKANRTLEFIRENREEWDQRTWGRCFAGHTVRLEGYEVLGSFVPARNEDTARVAAEILGFEFGQATCGCCSYGLVSDHGLFAGSNTFEDLEGIVKSLTSRELAMA